MQQSSANRKFDRGIEQIKQLRQEIDEFEVDEAIEVRAEPVRKSAKEIEVRCIAVQRDPTPEHWPLLAGEAIQNLRASLDHEVFTASGGNDQTQFPICLSPADFAKESKRRLAGVPASFKDSVERCQPYSWSPDHPGANELEHLRQLSNADKHRTLASVVCAVRMEAIGVAKDVEISWLQFGKHRILEVGSNHISTFIISARGKADLSDADPMFRFEVNIGNRPITNYVAIAQHVYRVLIDCQTGERLSPGAAYPIYPDLPNRDRHS